MAQKNIHNLSKWHSHLYHEPMPYLIPSITFMESVTDIRFPFCNSLYEGFENLAETYRTFQDLRVNIHHITEMYELEPEQFKNQLEEVLKDLDITEKRFAHLEKKLEDEDEELDLYAYIVDDFNSAYEELAQSYHFTAYILEDTNPKKSKEIGTKAMSILTNLIIENPVESDRYKLFMIYHQDNMHELPKKILTSVANTFIINYNNGFLNDFEEELIIEYKELLK